MARAEQEARKIAALVPEGSTRFTAEVKTRREPATTYSNGDVMFPETEYAVVTLRDNLTGGTLWMQWRSYLPGSSRPATTAFIGGSYSWTLTTKTRRIDSLKSARFGVLPTFLGV